jgi:MarR family transcriptional regulator, organic hydroperoxide resistance regulator
MVSMPSKPSATVRRRSRKAEPPAITGLLVCQLATLWQREVRPILDGLELTHAQFVLLNAAVSCGGGRESAEPVTQAQVAELARTDPVMTSEVLRTLESKGFLERRPHPVDARARRIVVTPQGLSTARRAARAVAGFDTRFFRTARPELAALAMVLKKQRKA